MKLVDVGCMDIRAGLRALPADEASELMAGFNSVEASRAPRSRH